MTVVLPVACVREQAAAASASRHTPRARRAGLVTGKCLLVKRLSVHVGGGIEAKESKHGGSDVDERRVLAVDFPAGEEHTGHQPGVDAVVPAPRLGVVLEDGARDNARRAVPRGAVAGVEADDEVWRVLNVGPT